MPRRRRTGPEILACDRYRSQVDTIVSRWFKAFFDTLPDTFYHYTGWDAFVGIIESQTVWQMDTTSMTDTHELHWADSFILDLARKLREEQASELLRLFVDQFEPRHITRVGCSFISCFTTDSDTARQWKNYGWNGKGVSIGFKRLPTERLTPPPGADLAMFPVTYDEEACRASLEKDIRALVSLHTEFSQAYTSLRGWLQDAGNALLRLTGVIALRFKDREQFQSEKEWRWVLTYPAGKEPKDLPRSPSGRRYIPLRLRDKGKGRFVLTEIILGVNCEHSEADVIEVLRKAGYTDEELPIVRRSSVKPA